MKRIVVALLLTVCGGFVVGQEGIRFFEGTWAEMLAKAKEQDKVIFMDAYATWCGPCKMMSANVFPNKEVGDFYNANFLPVKIDMEKGDGLALAKLYGVRAYPTLLFINWKGELVHRSVGARQAEGLIELGREALDDTRNFRSIEQAYMKHPTSIEHLIAYASALKQGYDQRYATLIKEYLKDQPIEILLSETGWKIINLFVEDPQSREFQFVVSNREIFETRFGKEPVQNKINEVIEVMINQALRKNDKAAMEAVKRTITDINPEKRDYYRALADARYSQRASDWSGFAKASLQLIALSPGMDSHDLNRYAWEFYLHVDDQKDLEAMTKRVAAAIKTDDEYAIHDTYAALLFKTKNYKQALKEAKDAITLAKTEGAPYEETLELISEIEKAMKK